MIFLPWVNLRKANWTLFLRIFVSASLLTLTTAALAEMNVHSLKLRQVLVDPERYYLEVAGNLRDVCSEDVNVHVHRVPRHTLAANFEVHFDSRARDPVINCDANRNTTFVKLIELGRVESGLREIRIFVDGKQRIVKSFFIPMDVEVSTIDFSDQDYVDDVGKSINSNRS